MAGSRGKGKVSATKSKHKTPSLVPAVPEPVVAEESSEGPSDGEENKIEIPSTNEKENDNKKIEMPSTVTDKKEEYIDATSGLVVGNEFQENQQLVDKGNDYEKSNDEKNDDENENNNDQKNDDEKDITNELKANEVYTLSGQTEELEEFKDGDDPINDVDSENDKVDTEEENAEELNDGGGAVNNFDVEDNEGKPDEEVLVEVKEPIYDCGRDENIHSGEENKDTEAAEDGKMVTGEGRATSEHGVIDEEMMSKEASDKPLSTSSNNEVTAEERENVNIANNVEASAGKAMKRKRKLIRKKLIEASDNEAKPQSSTVNDASASANSAETKEYDRNGEKAELKQPFTLKKELNRKTKSIVSESNAGGAASSDGQKAEPTNNEQGTEMLRETGKLEVEGEKMGKSGNEASCLNRKRKQKVSSDKTTDKVVPGDTNKPGPSRKGKSKKVDTTGMIFMCNSETKKDCYRYRVLGLPAGKKDFVLQIYKGMTLFLFDVQLKMLYGIYKAAAPGGIDIEPRAFKSKFPSQVRFTVLEDCVPLAEEKFKSVIKENYYTKNKFNCTLSSVQVGKLSTLFLETTRKADAARIVRNPAEAAPSSQRNRKRKRSREGRKAGSASSSKRERRTHSEREVRRGPAAVDDRYYKRPVYEREAYLPPPVPPVQVAYQALPPPSLPRPSSYSSGGPRRDDIYWQEPALKRVSVIEHRDLGLPTLGHPAEADRHEPYASYRETRVAYLDPAYETSIRRDLHESSARRDLHEPSARRDLHEPSARRDLHEPSARRDLHEPSARRDLYEPSARQDLYELSARRDLHEPSARRDLYEPSARQDLYENTSDARKVEYYATEYRPPLPPYRRY